VRGFEGKQREDIAYWLALNLLPGVGQILSRRLLDLFQHPKAIFSASRRDLCQVEGIGERLAQQIVSFAWEEQVDQELREVERRGIRILTLQDVGYPPSLRAIPDPPLILYVMGDIREEDELALAVVGSRSPTPYGRLTADSLSRGLAEVGLTIVSGMARGIDSIAHRAALTVGGRTIAVLGSGLGVIYPPENASLADKIAHSGALVSEFPLFTRPERGNFPLRNRLISGLSMGVIVVEAAANSGSLITAHHALEQNREVFAVPGNIQSPKSKGSNWLIKRGAKLVDSVADVLEELPLVVQERLRRRQASGAGETEGLSSEEELILSLLPEEGLEWDQVVAQSRLPIGRINSIVTMLELKGRLRQLQGKLFPLRKGS